MQGNKYFLSNKNNVYHKAYSYFSTMNVFEQFITIQLLAQGYQIAWTVPRVKKRYGIFEKYLN